MTLPVLGLTETSEGVPNVACTWTSLVPPVPVPAKVITSLAGVTLRIRQLALSTLYVAKGVARNLTRYVEPRCHALAVLKPHFVASD